MTQFRKLIQQKRLAKGDSIETMAAHLGISPSFAKHVIYSDIVPLSPRIIERLAKRYKISMRRMNPLAAQRNKIGKAYYRAWNKKNRAA